MEMVWLLLKKISYSLFLIMLFLACFDLGSSYQKHYAETGDNLNQWLEFKKEYKNIEVLNKDSIDDPLKYTYYERVNDYKLIVSRIRLSLLFIFLVTFFDYFLDKDEHWFTKAKERLEEMKQNV